MTAAANGLIYFIIAFFLTYLGIHLFRRWTLKRNLLDIPNERSSHTEPTPRGGGLVIVLVCLSIFFLFLVLTGKQIPWAYFAGALIVALISWIDDLYTISPLWRFMCHSAAALLAIWFLGFFENIDLPVMGGEIALGAFGALLTFVWIVWLINAYNFMDGIDGIAGVQALTAGLGWFLIGLLTGSENLSVFGGIIAFSSIGFLIHNWQPAKIFMGDVGSAFLGYTFAVLPLLAFDLSQKENRISLFTAAVLLVWLFVFDSVLTFLKRLLRGEKVWQAHRQHIYQKLVISGFSHQSVTLVYGLISTAIVGLVVWRLISGLKTEIFVLLIIFLLSVGLVIFSFSANQRKKLT